MDFLSAVREMKLGKKVRRKGWNNWYYTFKEDGTKITKMVAGSDFKNIIPIIADFEATDWEVVDDDKDWNLRYNGHIGYTSLIDLKKCRDLIIEDINIDYTSMCGIKQIINKRFGDL